MRVGGVGALAAAALAPVGADGHALHEALVGDEDDHLLALDEVLDIDLLDLVGDDLGAALVAVLLGDIEGLVLDDAEDLGARWRGGP